jgi:hypothetical protein
MAAVLPIDPSSYTRHALHLRDRDWGEANCYDDALIELVHAMGHEPTAMLAHALAVELDVDQWTLFKVPRADLEDLYGITLNELTVWRPLPWHVDQQVAAGRPVLVETDSFYLPDTAGAAYRSQHVKTTIVVNELDVDRRRMGYFHNQGYYVVEGDDVAGALRFDGAPEVLPPYIELVRRLPRGRALRGGELVEASVASLRRHLARVPAENPFLLFKERFAADQVTVPGLLGPELDTYHQYAFVTIRQFGAAFELSGCYLRWLGAHGVDGLDGAAASFDELSHAARALQMRLARSVMRGKPVDVVSIDPIASLWQRGMAALTYRFG